MRRHCHRRQKPVEAEDQRQQQTDGETRQEGSRARKAPHRLRRSLRSFKRRGHPSAQAVPTAAEFDALIADPCMSLLLPLADDEAHVWYAWTAECASPAQRAAYAALLTPDEQARCARLAFDELKAEYLLTRALCRSVLSRYAGVPPADWRFRSNTYGRPEIESPAVSPPLRFNLSNARSLVACIVTRRADAGIDVEETARADAPLEIADEFFSADELRELRALPAAEQGARFFDLWTLKESYIKARGLGLQIPLDRFSIRFGAAIGIAFDPGMADEAAAWQFHSLRLGESHTLSLALRRGTDPDFRIQLREIVPRVD